jgi:hypothetical protein
VLTALGLVLNLQNTKGPFCDTVKAGESEEIKSLDKQMKNTRIFIHKFLAPVHIKQTYVKPLKCNKLY